MNEIEVINAPQSADVNGCDLLKRGIVFPNNLTFEKWQELGKTLGRMEDSVLFWLGDWINYGEKSFGEKYAQALAATEYKYPTLRNAAYVCKNIQMSFRKDKLTFNHHIVVAPLKPIDQKKWLKIALTENWDRDELRKAIKDSLRDEKIKELAENSSTENENIVHGTFQERGHIVKDNSVDLIFTDPPYDAESIPLYGDLAEFGNRTLKTGGSLICYVGHYAIPEILNLMTPHLRFWWVISCKYNGQAARLLGKNVFVEWKPLLWFVKDGRANKEFVSDFILNDEQPSKDLHDWEQSIKAPEYYINHLTVPGALVCDPFCGTGTTCRAAIKMGREYIAFEKEEKTAIIARHLINEFQSKI